MISFIDAMRGLGIITFGRNSMQSKLNVKVALVITTPDSQPFHNSVLEWHNVPYEATLAMEKILLGAASEITKLGDVQVAAMKKGG
jgi:hypothetical protein